MTEQNIIQKDWNKIKKLFSSMREGFISLMVFLLRWMMALIFAGLIIKELSTTKWWIIIIVLILVYLALSLFHKTYDLEKWLINEK